MPLAEQLVHQRYVHPGPLVLRTDPLKFPTPATDRDRTDAMLNFEFVSLELIYQVQMMRSSDHQFRPGQIPAS